MLGGWSLLAAGQQLPPPFPAPLDPASAVTPLAHTPLPEEYVWTAGDVNAKHPDHNKFQWNKPQLRTEWHRFRKTFEVASIPSAATIYVAGPREAEVYLNGKLLAHFNSSVDAPIGFRVFHTDASRLLRVGDNVLAVQAIRGRGIVSADASPVTQQLTYGEVLAVKVVAAKLGVVAPAMVKSDRSWRSVVGRGVDDAWTRDGFDDSAWPLVDSLGGVESSRDLMQWSGDAGMYGWPGYMGMSSPLGTYALNAVAVTHVFEGGGSFRDLGALTGGAGRFAVEQASDGSVPTDADAPAVRLDFGREISGRLVVESNANSDMVLSIAYGESELEAMATGLTPEQRGGNYLGTNLLDVGAHTMARGPKSGFRYARVRFLRGSGELALRAEGIAYPVTYAGSFESSDVLLNRIWATGAYTVHLCMGDDLWDAPKRDRGRWAGDIDVEGRVISDVFGDKTLLERTLADLAPGGDKAVNGIPGYSALWITSLASLYAHSGDIEFLKARREALLHVLSAMDQSLDKNGAFSNRKHQWMFVDWSPGLYGYTPEATLGTSLEYLRGYRAGAMLLEAVGDDADAGRARLTAAKLEVFARRDLQNAGRLSWQIAALGVQMGLMDDAQAWDEVLSKVKQDAPIDQQITPYFNATVLDAMARTGHGREALSWMRAYWGGMLAEGATSFWESYDLRWPKDVPHLSLQADGTSGFFVSMAHGWSSWPTAWLSEEILGVREAEDGYRKVLIAPRLMDLDWARGAVPTPHGVIRISIREESNAEKLEVDVPPGIETAMISVEAASAAHVMLDGKSVHAETVAGGDVRFFLPRAGHHLIVVTR